MISKTFILVQEFSKSVQKYDSYSDLNIFKMVAKRLLYSRLFDVGGYTEKNRFIMVVFEYFCDTF